MKPYKKEFRKLQMKVRNEIVDKVASGWGVYLLSEKYVVKVSSLILEIAKMTKPVSRMRIGYKNDAYFTESEMLEGFQCNYEDLSASEKLIYDRL